MPPDRGACHRSRPPLDTRGDNRGYNPVETGRNAQVFSGSDPKSHGLDPQGNAPKTSSAAQMADRTAAFTPVAVKEYGDPHRAADR
jgi:hypothetical protein